MENLWKFLCLFGRLSFVCSGLRRPTGFPGLLMSVPTMKIVITAVTLMIITVVLSEVLKICFFLIASILLRFILLCVPLFSSFFVIFLFHHVLLFLYLFFFLLVLFILHFSTRPSQDHPPPFFLSLSSHIFKFFLLSLGWCFGRPGPSNVHVSLEFLGCCVESRRLRGRRGFTRPRTLKHNQNFTRTPPREER